eukprot:TRINITY_DN1413_c0_g1_i6.p1 TRINITY_DN1413_c0_g1~~TRINITY_DN1413_c0_g1_i6.p1  ORF type:complete len:482 (-),score=115.75 TRINITY_DN1413_c0_g1_i6:48-1493(-)
MESEGGRSKEPLPRKPPSKAQQAVVFVLTFVCYAMFHVTRKALSSSKKKLELDWGMSVQFLGLLDTVFLACYSVGLLFAGHVIDRTNPKVLLVIGSFGTATTAALFGAARVFNIHSEVYFGAMWGLNGMFQSLGWPCCVSIMGNWVGKNSRGRTFGIWSSNLSLGNICGLLVGTLCFQIGADWEMVFLGPAAFMAVWAILVGVLLRAEPDRQHRPMATVSDLKTSLNDVHEGPHGDGPLPGSPMLLPGPPSLRKRQLQHISHEAAEPAKNLSWFQVWLLPGVIGYTLANVFLRFVSYAVFFWLPLYISEALNETVGIADLMSSLFDAGGAVGGVTLGLIADLVTRQGGSKSMVIMPSLLAAVPAFYVYSFVSNGVLAFNCVMTFVCGMLINGSYNILVSAIPAEIGALSQLRGIMDGVGGIGSAAAGVAVAWISNNWGWGAVFYLLMSTSFISGSMLLQIWIQDAIRCKKHRKFGYTKVLR